MDSKYTWLEPNSAISQRIYLSPVKHELRAVFRVKQDVEDPPVSQELLQPLQILQVKKVMWILLQTQVLYGLFTVTGTDTRPKKRVQESGIQIHLNLSLSPRNGDSFYTAQCSHRV